MDRQIESWRNYWLMEAMLKSLPSKDPSTKIGAVAVGADNQILSSGFNGFPRGIHDTQERYETREVKYDYIIHGEMNLIANACRTGVSLKGSTIYVYGLPVCSNCANMLIQVGVKEVVSIGILSDRWNDSILKSFSKFKEVGIQYIHYVGDNPEKLSDQINILNYEEKIQVIKT